MYKREREREREKEREGGPCIELRLSLLELDSATRIQILNEVVNISHEAITLRNDRNSTIFLQAMNKKYGRLLWQLG